MSTLRIGIVGLGNMGGTHARAILAGKIPRTNLTAVCDHVPARLAAFAEVPGFTHHRDLIASGLVDAVIVATPHFDHTVVGAAVLAAGLHVLIEKPLSVHKADCEKLIAAYAARPHRHQVFAEMFNQRTDPRYRQLKELITSGELGEIRRISWIITDWFRTEAYYASGDWRATWSGEGGGVLMNQCPHQLDLMTWLFGMPTRVRAHLRFGAYHDIEVEDAATAYLEYANGATGTFITTTGEAPGTNRLEVAAERGRVIIDGEGLQWIRNATPMTAFSQTTKESFAKPPTWQVNIPTQGFGDQHNGILTNFTAAILDGAALIGPAHEGIHGVELANAMLMSQLWDRTVYLPLDSAAVTQEYQRLIAASRRKTSTASVTSSADFAQSMNGGAV
jgi:predicted dehydrogenase